MAAKKMKFDEDLFRKFSRRLDQTSKSSEKYLIGKKQTPPPWIFLLELLSVDKKGACVRWTYRLPYEFVVTNPQQIAAMWGCLKKNPKMTYTHFCRVIRYYYRKDIIEKVVESPFTYRFVRSAITESFLARSYSNNFESKCPLMKEPNYIRIKEYVSQNNYPYPSTAGFEEENFEFNSRPRSNSFASTDSTGSYFEELSDNASVCSSISSSSYSESSLRQNLQNYQKEIKAKLTCVGFVREHQPPDLNMFWMVNSSD